MCREKFPAFYGTGRSINHVHKSSQLFLVLMSQMNVIANPIPCVTLRNVLKPVTTIEISKKRGSSKMLHNVTHSSSVLHFETKNRKPKTLDLKKKKVTSLQCTVSLQISAVQFVLVRHRYQCIIYEESIFFSLHYMLSCTITRLSSSYV